MNKILSEEQCQIILQNRFKTQEIKLMNYDLKTFSEDAEGYMGEYYNLSLTYKLHGNISTEILFMKKKPVNDKQSEMAEKSNVYENEVLFYDVLLREFEAKGYDTSFAAKSFYCIPNEAIIMENLVLQGYKLLERNQMFDSCKIQCVLKALALYHGAGLAYEKSKTKELGKTYRYIDDHADILKEKFFHQYIDKNEIIMKFWDGCYKTILSLIDVLPKDEHYKKEFKSLFVNYKLGKIFVDETNFVKTLGHGDLWSNNIMFKFEGDVLTKCRLLDFQLLRYFYPAYDVFLFIYCNTDAAFRKKHLTEMYDYYYNTIGDIIQNYGYSINDIMSLEDFYKTLDIVKVEGLIQAVFTDTVTYIPKENLNNSLKSDDNSFETYIFNNSDVSVKAFQENGSFTQIISDLLYELYDALVARNENF